MNRNADASNFIWNSIGGCLNAGQSVIILMVISRVCGLETAGIFSIAFATGNLFMYLGNYGVRNYQVSDLKEKASFPDYVCHRILTVALMLLASAVYVLWSLLYGGYSAYKAGCVMAMCVLKAVDCMEEVFEGRYQQRGRLDRAGKLVTFRLIVSIGGMLIALAATGDLLLSTWIAVVLAAAASVFLIIRFRDTAAWPARAGRRTPEPKDPGARETGSGRCVQPSAGTGTPRALRRSVSGLMKACFPVCAANFLSFFMINEPKYAIDAAMDETAQACYNFIAMPVFVIQLLNMFMYQPLLIRMTQSYEKRERKDFLGYFRKITAGLLLIAVPVLLTAWLLGIPVLSALYATDLSAYRIDLMILLAGGVFLAFNGFYCAVLTIMRAQNRIPFMYLIGSALSLLVTPRMTRAFGIRGATVSFVCVMALVTLLLSILFLRRVSPYRFGENSSAGAAAAP